MLDSSYCHPRALQLMEEASAVFHSTAGLVRAATAISVHFQPTLRVEEIERSIAAYAGSVATQVPRIATGPRPLPAADVDILLAHLHHVLFEEAGFTGNTAAFYDPRNSLIHEVIARRLGIPISLGLLYKSIGDLLGLEIHGVNTPLHFLLEIGGTDRRMFVDPFCSGRLLWEEEVVLAAARSTGQPASEVLIERADHRTWVARMLRNLEAIFANAGECSQVRAMGELAAAAGVRV